MRSCFSQSFPPRSILAAFCWPWSPLGPRRPTSLSRSRCRCARAAIFRPAISASSATSGWGRIFRSALIPDKEQKITDSERKALPWPARSASCGPRSTSEQLVVRFRNPQDDATRLRNRELIEKYLGISMEWPKNNGLHLPDDFRSDGPHDSAGARPGIARRRVRPLSARLAEPGGVQTLVFDYPNDGPIAWSGDRLSDDLKALSARNTRAAGGDRGSQHGRAGEPLLPGNARQAAELRDRSVHARHAAQRLGLERRAAGGRTVSRIAEEEPGELGNRCRMAWAKPPTICGRAANF